MSPSRSRRSARTARRAPPTGLHPISCSARTATSPASPASPTAEQVRRVARRLRLVAVPEIDVRRLAYGTHALDECVVGRLAPAQEAERRVVLEIVHPHRAGL